MIGDTLLAAGATFAGFVTLIAFHCLRWHWRSR